ncbi:hypothetical protein [uncultured Aureimonas sp.]|uniref:hypothetical protein n=1 Tax=uncultured Aureimonas sp. TaxID=1604662 RepID=UPI0025F6A7B3|nr:hypothetical protein [uncultured Aureimonas sp.]
MSSRHAEDESWLPPEPSRASRAIALRSTASYRGSIVDAATNREHLFESDLEQGFIHIALASPEVVELHEQPPAVAFIDDDGRRAEHTFDALLVTRSGERVAIDVKPRSKIGRSRILDIQRRIREQVGTRFADRYLVRTEDHIHPDDVADARLVLRARRLADPAADAAIAEALPFLAGWCRLVDLVDAIGGGSAAFNAAVRALGSGVLSARGDARISIDAFVRRAA